MSQDTLNTIRKIHGFKPIVKRVRGFEVVSRMETPVKLRHEVQSIVLDTIFVQLIIVPSSQNNLYLFALASRRICHQMNTWIYEYVQALVLNAN